MQAPQTTQTPEAQEAQELAQLRARVADLERRLGQAQERIGAADRDLDNFSYTVSHDLRAPLNAILGFSEAVLEDYWDQLDATGRDYLTRIGRNTEKMVGLIEALLRLSRATRGELVSESVDLSALAAQLLHGLHAEQRDRQVAVSVQAGMTAQTDPRLATAVLDNLLRNAWKFTSGTADARIEIGAVGDAPVPTFFVRDNGAGFDMALADRLFRPFKRLHEENEFPGPGIGLAIVQRAVHRLGGTVRAEGAVGTGAVFYFTLPTN